MAKRFWKRLAELYTALVINTGGGEPPFDQPAPQSHDQVKAVISDDGRGCALPTFPAGDSLVLNGVSPATISFVGMLAKMGVPSFGEGTLIGTPEGWCRDEHLTEGQLVRTHAGFLPVIWHGWRQLDRLQLEAAPEQRLIRLKAGHFGPDRDLIVSPQRAICCGQNLVRARHLAQWAKGAHVERGIRGVTYHHFLLPVHALLQANGTGAESSYPGPEAMKVLLPPQRLAVAESLLRNRQHGGSRVETYGPRCLPLLSGREARTFLVPSDTGKPLIELPSEFTAFS